MIFSIAKVAHCSFDINIDILAPAFFKPNSSFIATVAGSELHHARKKSDESAFLDVKVSLWNVSNFYPTMVGPKFSDITFSKIEF